MGKELSGRKWYVYMVRCNDGSLYTGITVDTGRRLREHNGEVGQGARYTRPRRPVKLVYEETANGRGPAAKREFSLKALSRPEKEALISSKVNQSNKAIKIKPGARTKVP